MSFKLKVKCNKIVLANRIFREKHWCLGITTSAFLLFKNGGEDSVRYVYKLYM